MLGQLLLGKLSLQSTHRSRHALISHTSIALDMAVLSILS